MRAYRDLRQFLARRKPHEFGFLAAALFLTVLVVAGFIHDSSIPVPYHRDIIYMESWPENRTRAEVIAQQKIDQAKRHREEAILEAKRAERRAQFQRLGNQMDAWGF